MIFFPDHATAFSYERTIIGRHGWVNPKPVCLIRNSKRRISPIYVIRPYRLGITSLYGKYLDLVPDFKNGSNLGSVRTATHTPTYTLSPHIPHRRMRLLKSDIVWECPDPKWRMRRPRRDLTVNLHN